MSLQIGKKIHGNKWDIPSYDKQVVDTVTSLAILENQPELVKGNVISDFSLDENIRENGIEEEERNMAEENSNANSSVVKNEVRADLDDSAHDNGLVTDDDINENIHSDSDSDGDTINVEETAEIVDDNDNS